ncbi:MAG: 30S ribosomal protein S20 [Cytophagales bacterium]|nr:30S ribosomal protein S20 [Cytophagales bacterium]
MVVTNRGSGKKSAKKKWAVNCRRHRENLERTQRYKADFKLLKKITDISEARELLNIIKKRLDMIKNKHIYHGNKVNRLKSRCERLVNRLCSVAE